MTTKQQESEAGRPPGWRLRTLIVDDSSRARVAISEFLRTQDNILVVGDAVDGEDAIKQVAALAPDLVLADVQMPEMNGLELTRHLRAHFPATRVILITLYNSAGLEAKCLEHGADGFAPKNELNLKLPQEIRRIFDLR